MKKQIKKELREIEEEKGIRILYAVESGSRAWGFASTDSDWDVRFLYIHEEDWYLSIDDKKDNYVEILPNNIDLQGWELRKALKLFRKSNPHLLEYLNGPFIYIERYSTAKQLRELSKEYFNPKSCLHHYLNIAKDNYKDHLQKERVSIKKYFYALRSILACQWIEKTGTPAPVEFHKLLETQVNDQQLKNEINDLLIRKKSGEELNEEPKIVVLNNFLENSINYYTEYLKNFKVPLKPDTEKLNDLFRKTLIEVWV